MNTHQIEHLPRPYQELDTAFTRHQKAKDRLKNLTIAAVAIVALILAASWIVPEVKAIMEARTRDRYEEVHKIVLDGRGPVISHGAFTLNIPNLDASRYQIFSGTGAITITGNTSEIFPEWRGASNVDSAISAVRVARPAPKRVTKEALRP